MLLFQVPQGLPKVELISILDKIPQHIQQLSTTIKNPSVGKTATFHKVETIIQQTKDLMNVIAKAVTNCFICATKVSHLFPTFNYSINLINASAVKYVSSN